MWEPLCFFSRKLTSAQQKYSTFDRELLAIYSAIKHFRFLVEGRVFSVYTDHKPLTTVLFSKSERSPRQTNQLEYISQFTSDIRFLKGIDNAVADTLSRPNVDSVKEKNIDITTTANAQQEDSELNELLSNKTTQNFELKKIHVPIEEKSIWCEISTSINRPYIPKSLRTCIFHLIHNLSHPSIRVTRKLLTTKYFWPKINADVNEWSRACIACQKYKINKHTKSKFQEFNVPKGRFDQIHIDIVGPLPQSNGFTYLFTMIDRFSRWVEAIPLRNITASTIAEKLVSSWIARFGVPRIITSDQGSQFESLLFRELSNLLGNPKIRTSTYHPQSNGMVEKFHRHLKTALKAATNAKNWTSNLSWVLLGIRSAVKEDLGFSPAQLLYGQALRIPG